MSLIAIQEVHLSQLDRTLTEQEESGHISREIGMLPARRMTPDRQAMRPASWSVRFVHVDRPKPATAA